VFSIPGPRSGNASTSFAFNGGYSALLLFGRKTASVSAKRKLSRNDDDCFYHFDTIRLVPLIEGCCSLDSVSRFYVPIFCFAFRKKKCVKEKKLLVQDLIPPPSIYIHLCTLYTCTMLRFGPTGLVGPFMCLVPTLGLTSSTPSHTHIYTDTRVKTREDTSHIYTYMHVYINTNTCTHAHTHLCTLTHTHTHTHARKTVSKWRIWRKDVVIVERNSSVFSYLASHSDWRCLRCFCPFAVDENLEKFMLI